VATSDAHRIRSASSPKLPTGWSPRSARRLEALESADRAATSGEYRAESARPNARAFVQRLLGTKLGVSEQAALMVVNQADLLGARTEELDRSARRRRVSKQCRRTRPELGCGNIPEMLDRIEEMLSGGRASCG